MYCSSCREARALGLNYCNGCGAKLTSTKDDAVTKPAELFPESLVWAIVTVFIVGLGCLIGLMAMMKQLLNFSNELILGIALTVFLLLIAIESALIWLLVSQRKVANSERNAEMLTASSQKELGAADPRLFLEPVSSVTEKTTTKFDPVYRERK